MSGQKKARLKHKIIPRLLPLRVAIPGFVIGRPEQNARIGLFDNFQQMFESKKTARPRYSPRYGLKAPCVV
jgi:hypothetical protein